MKSKCQKFTSWSTGHPHSKVCIWTICVCECSSSWGLMHPKSQGQLKASDTKFLNSWWDSQFLHDLICQLGYKMKLPVTASFLLPLLLPPTHPQLHIIISLNGMMSLSLCLGMAVPDFKLRPPCTKCLYRLVCVLYHSAASRFLQRAEALSCPSIKALFFLCK